MPNEREIFGGDHRLGQFRKIAQLEHERDMARARLGSILDGWVLPEFDAEPDPDDLQLSDDEREMIRAYRAFSFRSPPKSRFCWESPDSSQIVLPSPDFSLIHHPRDRSDGPVVLR